MNKLECHKNMYPFRIEFNIKSSMMNALQLSPDLFSVRPTDNCNLHSPGTFCHWFPVKFGICESLEGITWDRDRKYLSNFSYGSTLRVVSGVGSLTLQLSSFGKYSHLCFRFIQRTPPTLFPALPY